MEQTEELFPDDLVPSDELCRTRDWRFDQLTALGFDALEAMLMADDVRVELAQARRLVAMGCPLATASRILLSATWYWATYLTEPNPMSCRRNRSPKTTNRVTDLITR